MTGFASFSSWTAVSLQIRWAPSNLKPWFSALCRVALIQVNAPLVNLFGVLVTTNAGGFERMQVPFVGTLDSRSVGLWAA